MDFEIISWPVGLDHDVDDMDDVEDFYSKKKDETRGGTHMACKGGKKGGGKKK